MPVRREPAPAMGRKGKGKGRRRGEHKERKDIRRVEAEREGKALTKEELPANRESLRQLWGGRGREGEGGEEKK